MSDSDGAEHRRRSPMRTRGAARLERGESARPDSPPVPVSPQPQSRRGLRSRTPSASVASTTQSGSSRFVDQLARAAGLNAEALAGAPNGVRTRGAARVPPVAPPGATQERRRQAAPQRREPAVRPAKRERATPKHDDFPAPSPVPARSPPREAVASAPPPAELRLPSGPEWDAARWVTTTELFRCLMRRCTESRVVAPGPTPATRSHTRAAADAPAAQS
jgi:hypothetical protein